MLGVALVAVEKHLAPALLRGQRGGHTRRPLRAPPIRIQPLAETRHDPAMDTQVTGCGLRLNAII